MTLDEIKARHEENNIPKRRSRDEGFDAAIAALDDRAQLLAWLDAALPWIRGAAGLQQSIKDDFDHVKETHPERYRDVELPAVKLLAQMGVKQ